MTQLISIPCAARLAGVQPATVLRAIRAGRLDAVAVGSSPQTTVDWVMRWLENEDE